MTHRHTPPVISTTWTVVADRCRARILSCDEDNGTDISEIKTLINPEGSLHQSDCVSDRQGYFGGREGALEAGDPTTSFAQKSADTFAAQLIEELEAGRNHGLFGRLNILAAPMFLGVLRHKLPVPLARMVQLEIDKDYTECTPKEVAAKLAKFKTANA